MILGKRDFGKTGFGDNEIWDKMDSGKTKIWENGIFFNIECLKNGNVILGK